jgi:hypothetical protein
MFEYCYNTNVSFPQSIVTFVQQNFAWMRSMIQVRLPAN